MPLRYVVPTGTVIGPWRESVNSLGVAAGTQTLSATVVPPGQVWMLEASAGWNTVTANSYIAIQLTGIEVTTLAQIVPAAKSYAPQLYSPILLWPGERARLRFGGCVAGDKIYSYFAGTKFSIELY